MKVSFFYLFLDSLLLKQNINRFAVKVNHSVLS